MPTFWKSLPKPIIALSPMEGVTDSAFRRICKDGGADIVYTEFISSDAIGHGAEKALKKMAFDDSERPVICQIFGKDPDMFVHAATLVEQKGFDGLDINFGCPAKRVVRHGSGVALLRDPTYCRRLIESVMDVVSIPVSIKVRTSIRKESKEVDPTCEERVTALDLLDAIQDLPVAAIMVHGRSHEQGHKGDVDTDMIREVKRRFPGVVLANGGIFMPKDAETMLEATGADGVGIARGSQGKTWIFRQIKDLLADKVPHELSFKEVRDIALRHAAYAFETKDAHGIIELRKHLAWYIKGIPGAAKLRAKLVRVNTVKEIEEIIDSLSRTTLK